MGATFDLKERLEKMGLTPKKAFGQNFLVSQNVIEKIILEVKKTQMSDLVEIGPGLGALTNPLLEAGYKPTLVEFDADLIPYWQSQNLKVIEIDALLLDWQQLSLRPESALVSNLPYQISTHLVIERCLGPSELKTMILMFQKEVAERIMAPIRSKEYGMISVMAQLAFKISRVVDAAPKDFYPAPKVASRVLKFTRQSELSLSFLKFLKAAFQFRRKFLLKNIRGYVDKTRQAELNKVFMQLGLSEKVRAEELTPTQFLALFKGLNLKS